MINYAALKAHVIADPVLAALAGAAGAGDYPNSQDENIAQAINGRTLPSSKKVPVQDAFLYLLKNLKWRGIKAAATNPQHAATEAAFTAVELILAPNMAVDFRDSVSVSLLNTMTAASLITQSNNDALQALSASTTSEAESRYGQKLHNLDVARAFGRVGFGA